MAEHAEGPVPGARVIHFTTQTPGFIPAGAQVTGLIAAQSPVVVGFIPAKSAEVEIIEPEPLDDDDTAAPEPVVDATPEGVCPICGRDYRDKPKPLRAVKNHIAYKHTPK
jgi:hypothetical protein